MNNRWVKNAVDEAKKSTFHIKVGAVIFNKSKFVSSGHNHANRSIKKHHPRFRKTEYSIHAEVDAIIKAKTDLKGKSILIVRINNNDKFRLAKPCKYCLKYIRHVGIKRIYYSVSQYPYIKMEKV